MVSGCVGSMCSVERVRGFRAQCVLQSLYHARPSLIQKAESHLEVKLLGAIEVSGGVLVGSFIVVCVNRIGIHLPER